MTTHDELVEFLISIKISEDEAARWAGRAKASVVLIPSIERTEVCCGRVGCWGKQHSTENGATPVIADSILGTLCLCPPIR